MMGEGVESWKPRALGDGMKDGSAKEKRSPSRCPHHPAHTRNGDRRVKERKLICREDRCLEAVSMTLNWLVSTCK
jgi:hypothetical protein